MRFQHKFGNHNSSEHAKSSGSNDADEIDENPSNPNRGGINLPSDTNRIVEEHEFEGSSLMNQRIRRNASANSIQPVRQGINLMNMTANF